MLTALIAAAIAAAVLTALFFNGRAYVARVERQWPAIGRFIEFEGARLHVVERGPVNAPRVLLIHGANANLRELLSPLADLQSDHRVIAYDRPGHGYSGRMSGAQLLAMQARCAAAVLEATGGPAIVFGHSLGAAVVLRLALDRPDLVRGIVVAAPACHPYPGNNSWWARLASTPLIGRLFATTIVPLVGPPMMHAAIRNVFAPAPVPAGYEQDAAVALALRPSAFIANARDVCATKAEFAAQAPLYPEIQSPAVIVTTHKDRVVSPKLHARALASELSVAEMVTAPGAGHMPHRTRTDLVIAAIRRVEAMASAAAES